MFDSIAVEKLGYYVYALIDPKTDKPFYIGKGVGNRIFSHLNCAIKEDAKTLKLDKIREILSSGKKVKHIIIRHKLTEKESFEVEASLIDFGSYLNFDFTNIVDGHRSQRQGLMTANEIIRLYNAKTLNELYDPVIIININKRYFRGNSRDEIYNSTKEAWVVAESKRNTVKYVLAEYTGIIIEVFEIEKWYKVKTDNKTSNRWGFEGRIAEDSIRDKYINKSIAHTKKQGAVNPIKYKL